MIIEQWMPWTVNSALNSALNSEHWTLNSALNSEQCIEQCLEQWTVNSALNSALNEKIFTYFISHQSHSFLFQFCANLSISLLKPDHEFNFYVLAQGTLDTISKKPPSLTSHFRFLLR